LLAVHSLSSRAINRKFFSDDVDTNGELFEPKHVFEHKVKALLIKVFND